MDGTMDFAPKSSQATVHPAPASAAGFYLQPQHHADNRLHSPVPGSAHWNQYPSSFPSSVQYPSASTHPHQHQQFHQHQINAMVMEPDNHSQNAPAVISRGFNGQNTFPPAYPQPVVQQVPTVSTTSQSQVKLLQCMDQYMQMTSEANKRFNNDLMQLLQLQHVHLMEQMELLKQIVYLHLTQAPQQATIATSSPTVFVQQEMPTAILPNAIPVQNRVDSTGALINQPQHSMDQPTVPVYDGFQQQQQQNETQSAIVHSIAVPTPAGGISENLIKSTLQHEHTAGVPKSSSVGSTQSVMIINIFPPAYTARIIAYNAVQLKCMQHLLDRNGHRMDSSRRWSFSFSDVFSWMVNQGLIDRRPTLSVPSFPLPR